VTALADLPKLVALPDGSFDVVVAFGVIEGLERPEELVEEAKRLLKEGGVLLVSVADKRATVADGRGGMYVPEFRRLLERYFGHVRLYRQGAVAGGLVFPVSGELSAAAAVPAESVRLSSGGPRLGGGLPTTRSVMAVCAEAAEVLGEEGAYLLVDHDRRVFDECEGYAEDVELMQGEIRRMQETEVQAFVEAIKIRQSLVRELLRSPYSYRNLILQEIRYRQSIIRGNMRALRQKGAVGSTKGAFRRLSVLYRRLRAGHKP
jgi:SAM-dependent methyltransferase